MDLSREPLSSMSALRFSLTTHFSEGEGQVRRKRAYNWLVETGYSEELNKHLLNKLWKRGLPSRPHHTLELHTNYSIFPYSFPPHFRSDNFDILMNAVPTGRRTLSFTVPDRAERLATHKPPCLLCGQGEDSVEHLFDGSCEVVRLAREGVTSCLAICDARDRRADRSFRSPAPTCL